MSRSKYRKRKNSRSPQEWAIISSFFLMIVLLVSSVFSKKDPVTLIGDLFSNGEKTSEQLVPYDTLVSRNQRLQNDIDQLEEQLSIYNGKKQYKRAMIDIESKTVNMRSQASLSSDILLQIPDRSIVQVLFYDTKKYILNEKYGKWCKISYAGTEGWVWGNFISEIEN